MKHVWALPSAAILTTGLVVSGVHAGAATAPGADASEAAATWPAAGPAVDHASGSTGAVAAALTSATATTVAATGFPWQLTTAQEIVPGTTLVARSLATRGAAGTRSDTEFFTISATGDKGVPEAALRAYRGAELAMTTADPDCEISWTLLAAIGRVESDHGRYGTSDLGADGVSRPDIRGPRLDGAGPFAAIADSDEGRLDRDKVWDRAVGAMQFLPETWRSVARDGDRDGVRDPQDIDDSALASAVYLCQAGGSVAVPSGMARAAFRYNHSDYYVDLVTAFESGYRTGVFTLPSPPPPPSPDAPPSARTDAPKETGTDAPKAATKDARPPRSTHKPASKADSPTAPKATSGPTATPTPKPSPAAPAPSPTTPSPKPSVSPAPATGPQLVTVSGGWTACGPGFCLAGQRLDLGPDSRLGNRADGDFDGDGTTESNAEEFDGLTGRRATVRGERSGGGLIVYVIEGRGYRNADGSLARASAPAAVEPGTVAPGAAATP